MGTSLAVTSNNVTAIVGLDGYTAGSGTLTLSSGQGASFPVLTGDQFYRLTVIQANYASSSAATLLT